MYIEHRGIEYHSCYCFMCVDRVKQYSYLYLHIYRCNPVLFQLIVCNYLQPGCQPEIETLSSPHVKYQILLPVPMREREREREREGGRERERERERMNDKRESEKQTDRQTGTDRQGNRQRGEGGGLTEAKRRKIFSFLYVPKKHLRVPPNDKSLKLCYHCLTE